LRVAAFPNSVNAGVACSVGGEPGPDPVEYQFHRGSHLAGLVEVLGLDE
jgi:hypothetical protein